MIDLVKMEENKFIRGYIFRNSISGEAKDLKKIKDVKFCPTCGQPMEYVKTEEDKENVGNPFEIFQIWRCLNCNAEWEVDIMRNIFRLKEKKIL